MSYFYSPGVTWRFVELLEPRALLAAQIDFPDFASTTNLVGNGFDGGAITSGNAIVLTDGGLFEKRSVWFDTPVSIGQFTTQFSFQSEARPDSADGFTFTVQNGSTTALGADGGSLGYTGIANSEAIAFNMYNFNAYGSKFGFASDGELPKTESDISPIDLHSGRVFDVIVSYDGTHLSVTVTDASNPGATFSASKPIDLPAAIGSDTAFVGFTAGTGLHFSTQTILDWTFSGSDKPAFTTPATASSSPVTGTTTGLSALGSDSAGEENLTYTWSLLSKPSGAQDPTFSANGTNGAKSITATFFRDGTYTFRCTITNPTGGTATSDVSVLVEQTATLLRITPHKQQVKRRESLDYNCSVIDQFNRALRTQPTIVFSLDTGPGTIDPLSGLFTASETETGHTLVRATAGALTGVSGGTVIA